MHDNLSSAGRWMRRGRSAAAIAVTFCLASHTSAHQCVHDTPAMQQHSREVMEHAARLEQTDPHLAAHRRAARGFRAQATRTLEVATRVGDLGNTDRYCAKAEDPVPSDIAPEVKAIIPMCRAEDVLTDQKREYLKNQILPAAVKRVQMQLRYNNERVKINPPQGACSNKVNVLQADTDNGIDADFVLYVTAWPTHEGTLAWAAPCYPGSGRPTVGHANFGPKYIDLRPSEFNRQVNTAAHEMLHALGFTSTYLTKLSNKDIARRGKTVKVITSPKVVEKFREFTGCKTTEGPELEDEGSAGSAGSHWEKRLLSDELMAAAGGSQLTEMTLAAFEDFGWGFAVNYTKAEFSSFGRNSGCEFMLQKCDKAGGGKDREFCFIKYDPSGPQMCTSDRIAVGTCGAKVRTPPAGGWKTPSYFSGDENIRSDLFLDGCPVVEPFTNRVCTNASNEQPVEMMNQGYTFGAASRCFAVDGVIKSLLSPMGSATAQSRCFKTRCHNQFLQFIVGDGGKDSLFAVNTAGWMTCPTPTASVRHLPGYRGSVKCFDYRHACPVAAHGRPPQAHTDGQITVTMTLSGSQWGAISGEAEQKLQLEDALRIDVAALLEVSLSGTAVMDWKAEGSTLVVTMRADTSDAASTVKSKFDSVMAHNTWMPHTTTAYKAAGGGDEAQLTKSDAKFTFNLCGRIVLKGKRFKLSNGVCYAIIAGLGLLVIGLIVGIACCCYCCCCRRSPPPPQPRQQRYKTSHSSSHSSRQVVRPY